MTLLLLFSLTLVISTVVPHVDRNARKNTTAASMSVKRVVMIKYLIKKLRYSPVNHVFIFAPQYLKSR